MIRSSEGDQQCFIIDPGSAPSYSRGHFHPGGYRKGRSFFLIPLFDPFIYTASDLVLIIFIVYNEYTSFIFEI